MSPAALALAGPTASGKSEFALALAAQLPIEIISVDSAQVYRGLDIGSAKPDAASRVRVPHHLLDLREPHEAYSAGDFVEDALRAIDQIRGRGRVPLLVGGTMLYFRALLHGMAQLPRASPQIRLQLDAQAAEQGWPALHAQLALIDPDAAAGIHPNDPQRIQRALEVYRASGRPISDWQRDTRPPAVGPIPRWALVPADRVLLRQRIADRFDEMLARGLLAEVERLRADPRLGGRENSLRAVGYRQLWMHLQGKLTLEQAREQAITATWQLARRQLTWLRADPTWQIVDPLASGAAQSWRDAAVAAWRPLR